MITTNLTATSQLRGNKNGFGTVQLRRREIGEVVARSRRFVTERTDRLITGSMHSAVPNAFGQADNPKVVVVPQDHQR